MEIKFVIYSFNGVPIFFVDIFGNIHGKTKLIG